MEVRNLCLLNFAKNLKLLSKFIKNLSQVLVNTWAGVQWVIQSMGSE